MSLISKILNSVVDSTDQALGEYISNKVEEHFINSSDRDVVLSENNDRATTTVSLAYQGPATTDLGKNHLFGINTALYLYNSLNPSIKVTLKIFDDNNDPVNAVVIANLINPDPSIVGVIGPVTSSIATKVMPLYTTAKIPCISPSAEDTKLTSPLISPYFYRIIGNDSIQGQYLAKMAIKGLTNSAYKAYIICDDSSYGLELANNIKIIIKSSNISGQDIVDSTDTAQNISDKVVAIKPDIIIYCGTDQQIAAKFVNDLLQRSYKGKIFLNDYFFALAFIATLPKTIDNIEIISNNIPFDLVANDAQKAAFTRESKLSSAQNLDGVTEGFNATNCFLDAIKKNSISRRTAIQTYIQTQPFKLLGYTNPIKFTKGDISQPYFASYKVQNGIFVFNSVVV
jgi:ABC-type branched-subunit amino acid transport system substrate-binding protein